jgi:hypothetical protein
MKTYKVVYNFQYTIEVDADSAEEAASMVQQIDWDDWDETWEGPFVSLEASNLIENILLEMCRKEVEEG